MHGGVSGRAQSVSAPDVSRVLGEHVEPRDGMLGRWTHRWFQMFMIWRMFRGGMILCLELGSGSGPRWRGVLLLETGDRRVLGF